MTHYDYNNDYGPLFPKIWSLYLLFSTSLMSLQLQKPSIIAFLPPTCLDLNSESKLTYLPTEIYLPRYLCTKIFIY